METLAKYLHFNIYAICFIAIGLLIRYFIAKRRFNRRGIGGLQHYSSYGVGLVTTIVEWLFKWLGNILLIAGIFMLIKW